MMSYFTMSPKNLRRLKRWDGKSMESKRRKPKTIKRSHWKLQKKNCQNITQLIKQLAKKA